MALFKKQLFGTDGFVLLTPGKVPGHLARADDKGVFSRETAERITHAVACYDDLLEACQLAIPSGLCLTNRNIPDDFNVALDCTMGDLRKIAAAIAKATGNS